MNDKEKRDAVLEGYRAEMEYFKPSKFSFEPKIEKLTEQMAILSEHIELLIKYLETKWVVIIKENQND